MLAGRDSTRSDGTPAAPSALLTATTRLLHWVMPGLEFVEHTGEMEIMFSTSCGNAMSAFSDSLPDKLWLCACFGAIDAKATEEKQGPPGCKQIMMLGRRTGILDLIATTLEQAMQVGHMCHCCTYFMGVYSLTLYPLNNNMPVCLQPLRHVHSGVG